MEFTPPFGGWLKQRRQALDLSIEDLARQAGYAAATLRKFEIGARRPSRQAAGMLADHLHIPAAEREAFIAFARGGEYRRWRIAPPTSSLIGRVQDVQQVRDLLARDDLRLLTLVGPPGVGKTRLALEAARQSGDAFRAGACSVSLAAISDPGQVGDTIAEMLQIRRGHDQPAAEALAVYLADRQLLLLLDNFEHLLPAAPLVSALLACAPGLKVLATSREMLQLTGEHVVEVAPLAVPVPDPNVRQTVQSLSAYPAVELFVARARQARPSFALTQANAPAVAELCRNLDGLPLAIELAAARTRAFTPQTIVNRLDHLPGARLRFLDTGARDLPPRQQALRATIDWSYNLLDPDEQYVFRQLGVFVGGCTLEAAEAVCIPPRAVQPRDFARLIETLVDKSLLQQVEGMSGEGRYSLLETIREYAQEKLDMQDELAVARRRHVHFFSQKSMLDINATEWSVAMMGRFKWLVRERQNLLAALAWSRDAAYDDVPLLHLHLASALGWVAHVGGWYYGTHIDNATMAAEVQWSMQRNPNLPPTPRANALQALSLLAFGRNDFAAGLRYGRECLDLCHATGLAGLEVASAHLCGWNTYPAGDLDGAEFYFARQLQLGEQIGASGWVMNGMLMLGLIAMVRRDLGRATGLLERALSIARASGLKTDILGGEAAALQNLGVLAYEQGDYGRAYQLGREALLIYEEEGPLLARGHQHLYLGEAAQAQGRNDTAEWHFKAYLKIARECGLRQLPYVALARLAVAAGRRGDTARYARLMGALSARNVLPAQSQEIQNRLQDEWYCTALADARARLLDAAFAHAWADGQTLTATQIIACALEEPG